MGKGIKNNKIVVRNLGKKYGESGNKITVNGLGKRYEKEKKSLLFSKNVNPDVIMKDREDGFVLKGNFIFSSARADAENRRC